MRLRNKQSGLALITVLFIFALVSMVAMNMQQRQARDIALSSSSLQYQQAQVLALSAEDLAKAGLTYDAKRDIEQSEEWDTASELWNQPLTTELAPARVFVTVRDLQGLFNLNWLHPEAPDPNSALQRFQELLKELQLDVQIAQNLKEWMTPDSSANYEYQSLPQPYSASEIRLSHPSELLLIKGVDIEAFKKLEPYVTALPPDSQLNINTTIEQVLSSWDPRLTLDQAATVTAKTRAGQCGPKGRGEALYKTVDELWQTQELSNLVNPDEETKANGSDSTWLKSDFTVKSEYFSVMIRVQYGDVDLVTESILRRDMTPETGFIGVVYRDFSRTLDDISRLKIVNC